MQKEIDKKLINIYERKLRDYPILMGEKWGIYGTGNGAEIVYRIFEEWNRAGQIVAFIENDESLGNVGTLHGIEVCGIEVGCEMVDGIIVGAMDNHEIVYERIKKYIHRNNRANTKIVNIFAHNTNEDIRSYVEFLEKAHNKKDDALYREYNKTQIVLNEFDTRVIAWYLPQFHRIDVNDKYYGAGFTEWTNTSRAFPMFAGHYQPHIPYDVGYYDLNNNEVFLRQIDLAKHYGVYGFSFYYYWFSGKRIMEKPLEYFLKHSELKMNFCITWANENWTSTWDGGNNDLIFEQVLLKEDDIHFIEDLVPYISDPRYIKIDGKSLLIVYRPTIWDKDRVKILFENFRNEAGRRGVGDLYIMICNARGFDEEAAEWGADALVEFPPHGIGKWTPVVRIDGYLNPNFMGHIRSTEEFIKNKRYLCEHDSKKYFRGAMPSWDNTARKAYNGATIYTGLTPKTFEQWMSDIISESKKIHTKEENIVFVNAWNEWAEGTHMEPDMKYGYANLEALRNAIVKNR